VSRSGVLHVSSDTRLSQDADRISEQDYDYVLFHRVQPEKFIFPRPTTKEEIEGQARGREVKIKSLRALVMALRFVQNLEERYSGPSTKSPRKGRGKFEFEVDETEIAMWVTLFQIEEKIDHLKNHEAAVLKTGRLDAKCWKCRRPYLQHHWPKPDSCECLGLRDIRVNELLCDDPGQSIICQGATCFRLPQ
jgi:hypothetical protein